MSVTLCPHGARGLMACPECEKAAFKPKPTTKRRCRICGGNHGEEWHALGAYAKIVEEERDQAERERDEARAQLSAEQAKGNWQGQHELEMTRVRERNLRERLEQAVELLRMCLPVLDPLRDCNIRSGIESITAGQPAPKSLRVRHADGEDIAPVTPVVDDAMVDRAQTAYTDTIVRSMASYSDELVVHPMRAALVAALEGRG